MSDLKDVALREEVRAFLEKFPKRGGPVMARAIFDAKDGKNKMLNLIRAQRNAGAENISAQNYYETQMEVGDGQSIKIRVYNAEPERPKTALIYLHGGGVDDRLRANLRQSIFRLRQILYANRA